MSGMRIANQAVILCSLILTTASLFTCSQVIFAQDAYFNSSTCAQSSCHDYLNSVPSADPAGKDVSSSMPKTCNGCHAHGTQLDTSGGDNQNLLAQTRLFEYDEGDIIYVDFNGGNRRWRQGWVKVTLYDENGDVLDSNTGCIPDNSDCEFPQTLAIPARPDLKRLFVGWLGYNMDKSGSQVTDTLGTTFNIGNRYSLVPGHVEVIIATNAFTVKAGTGGSSGGGGSGSITFLELALFALAGMKYKKIK